MASKMSRKRWFIVGGVALVVILVVGMNLRNRGEKAIPVEIAAVERGRVVQEVVANGQVQPEVQVKISANVSGRIDKLGVKEGQRVAKGDFLVQLDRTRYEAAVESARAMVSGAEANARLAKANLDQAERDLKRLEDMRDPGLTSQEQVDAARTAVSVGNATYDARRQEVAQARAALRQAEDDLEKTRVVAPMDGVVSQLNSEVGEVVLGTSQFEGTHIMTVADLSRMEVEVEVDENDIIEVALNDTASIEVDALPDTTFKGLVTEIANTAITRGRGTQEQITHFPVKIAFLDVVPELRPGMSATVEITTDTREDAVQVPIQAVTMRELPSAEAGGEGDTVGGPAIAEAAEDTVGETPADKPSERVEVVFVVKDGHARMRHVTTGISGETNLEITSGLEPGEQIVVGNYRALSRDLEDGSSIEPEKAQNSGRGSRD